MVTRRYDEQGRVAVLVSHGWGAGWYTWHHEEDLVYDASVVDMVLAEAANADIVAYCQATYGTENYYGGVDGLAVHWVDPGVRFRIDEYDGAESLVLENNEVWLTA